MGLILIGVLLMISLAAFLKVRQNHKFAHWVTEKQIKLSVGAMNNIIEKHKIDETTMEGFNQVQEIMFKDIIKKKQRFGYLKQQEIEDSVGIGIASYMDLIILYTYVHTQNDESESFLFFREKFMPIATQALEDVFLPTTVFHPYF